MTLIWRESIPTVIWTAIRRGDSRDMQGYTAWRLNKADAPYAEVGARAKPVFHVEFLCPAGQLVNRKKKRVTVNFAVRESMVGSNSCAKFYCQYSYIAAVIIVTH